MRVRQKIIFALVGLSLLFLFLLTVFGDKGLIDLNRLNNRKKSLLEKNQTIEQENIELYKTVKRARSDPEYIENIARDELGMVGKDEIIIKFNDKEAPQKAKTGSPDKKR